VKFIGYKEIKGTIEVITGLHIGGSTNIIEIGGKDNPVIKHPLTKEPYIPGSSLKGKMRSLMEWRKGLVESTDKHSRNYGQVHICNKPDCPVCVIFGSTAEKREAGPTRLIVRDAKLSSRYVKEQKKRNPSWEIIDTTEEKYENTINRITARANPRNFERVIAGVQFDFEMIYRIFDFTQEQDEAFFNEVIEILKVLENDTLGGAGSRGCGQVKFKIYNKSKNQVMLNELNINEDFQLKKLNTL
jgi:CRISPR-associated protein Csm3